MFTNRRLIETIRGRATAGDSRIDPPLAARPRVVRAARRATLAVGSAALVAALAGTAGGPLLRTAADAGLAGAGQRTAVRSSGAGSRAEAELEGQSASAPVAAALPGGTPATPARLLATPPVQLLAAPAAPVTPPPAPVAQSVAVAAPPVTVAPAPPAPGSVEAIIHEVFGPYGAAAVRVARCESGLNPRAVSRGGRNWGLFQINTVHRGRVAAMGYQWEDVLDARVNALVARSIFDEQGWRPWGCRRAAR